LSFPIFPCFASLHIHYILHFLSDKINYFITESPKKGLHFIFTIVYWRNWFWWSVMTTARQAGIIKKWFLLFYYPQSLPGGEKIPSRKFS